MIQSASIAHSRPFITSSDIHAVIQALQEKSISSYRYAELLRERLVHFSGFTNCLLFATGTLALRSALLLSGLKPNSGIAIPSFTCPDLITAVVAGGFRPVIIDCDKSGLLDAEKVREAYNRNIIRGAVAVHQFGLLNLSMQAVTNIMPVIEDCCHVPPRAYLDGSVAIFGSFEGTKLLGAGEGGYLLMHNLPSLAHHDSSLLGNRLSDLVAVLALRQLDKLDENLQRRETLALAYASQIGFCRVVDGVRAAWFRFMVEADSQEQVQHLIDHAQARGIALRRPIMPVPLHRLGGQTDFFYPVASSLWERLVSIPLYPDITEDEKERILSMLAGLGI